MRSSMARCRRRPATWSVMDHRVRLVARSAATGLARARGPERQSSRRAQGFGLTVLQAAASDVGARRRVSISTRRASSIRCRAPLRSSTTPPRLPAPHQHRRVVPFNPAEVAEAPTPGSRILVIEDEALVALQLQADLESVGHQVVGPARSLKAGMSLVDREEIDVALSTSASVAKQALRSPIGCWPGMSRLRS